MCLTHAAIGMKIVPVFKDALNFSACLILARKKIRADGALVDVLQRHPTLGEHPVKLNDPAHQIGIGLLPEGFLPLPE